MQFRCREPEPRARSDEARRRFCEQRRMPAADYCEQRGRALRGGYVLQVCTPLSPHGTGHCPALRAFGHFSRAVRASVTLDPCRGKMKDAKRTTPQRKGVWGSAEGAEAERCRWQRKRGESAVRKGGCAAADYSELWGGASRGRDYAAADTAGIKVCITAYTRLRHAGGAPRPLICLCK